MSYFGIDWTRQHCGIYQGSINDIADLMPDLIPLMATFPDNCYDYVFDVKVHMLMPNQYPCSPNWHCDHVPRVDGKKRPDLCQLDRLMYLWLSGPPFTEFREVGLVPAATWFPFTQGDEHRGTMATEHCWRGFIRATHKDIMTVQPGRSVLRRHSQVYLDAASFTW